jgi:hypothetical protein
MALNNVSFIKGQGGLGRSLPGEDYISGMIFYSSTLPSGFDSNNRIKHIFSVQDAEGLGITNTYSDETKATGTYLFTNIGTVGNTIELKIQSYPTPDNATGVVSLGAYATIPTDTTVTILGASYAATINAGTSTHGYTATAATGTVTITAPAGMGIFLNSGTPITATIVGTIAGTITQFASGAYSKLAVWHYHISEYFRKQPQGDLYVAFYAVPSTYDFAEVSTVQHYTLGKVRQFAVYADGTTYTSAKVQALQAVCDTLSSEHMPCSALLTFDYSAATLGTLADLSGINSPNVSVIIGQDGFALGYRLYKAVGRSITTLGATLGLVSLSKVSDDIAWIGAYNIAGGDENDVAAFANGVLFSATTTALLNSLNTSRYIFLIKKIGKSGTWVNDSHTCSLISSDYAYIENNRTIDKAIRNLYTGYLDSLNSPILLNSDGTLSDTSVAYFTSLGEQSLDQMVRDAEISAKSVVVDPAQNVLSTNKLTVAVSLVPVGVARNIVVKIKYTLNL